MRKHIFSKLNKRLLSVFIAVLTLFSSTYTMAFAAGGNQAVAGKVYEFDKDSHYEFSSSKPAASTDKADTYGVFSVAGNISEVFTQNGVPGFRMSEGKLSILYSYTDKKLNAGDDEWHLVDDKSKKVDVLTLGSDIKKGTIIVQTSRDCLNWINVGNASNVFEENPVNTDPIYTAQDIQIINGCYYRVIVAYELSKRSKESNFLFVDTSKYEFKKVAEVYEFYACTDTTDLASTNQAQTYNLGSAVRVAQFEGYHGEKPIEKDDPHYGLTIGQFYVSGYTDTASPAPGDVGDIVFLKNAGDKVTLWFRLKQNIDAIGGNIKKTITADKNGHDQYFQTTPTNFGRGTLIIRYTDYQHNPSEPQIYTNYLEANTSLNADTKVSLFEEGDYEVALDYEITEDKLIDTVAHYRIFFKFSIRNGNCMAFPFDLNTGDELTNSSMTDNGFRLDLAKSRYLKVIVKREMLADSADGLVEDTRSNGPAKDGEEYNRDGIYTITVTNQYTNQQTIKKIYVGTNKILRAYMATGLPITEINDLLSQGAAINDDGTITMPPSPEESPQDNEQVEPDAAATEVPDDQVVQPLTQASDEERTETIKPSAIGASKTYIFIGVCAAVLVVIISAASHMKRRKQIKPSVNTHEKGGDEQ